MDSVVTQEMFDIVVTHARKQGGRCLSHEEFCRYRGEGGTKCFVGALIKDEHYSFDLEGKAVAHYRVLNALRNSGWNIPEGGSDDLLCLQEIHDRSYPVAWSKSFYLFAKGRGLAYVEEGE